jgi:WD40 repeat protein
LPTGKKQFFYPQDSPFNFVAFENGPPSLGLEEGKTATLLQRQQNGLFRLPVIANQEGEAVGIGPAENLGVAEPDQHIVQSRDGSVVVLAQFHGALIRRADQPDKPIKIEGHYDVRNVAVSPDGRWVATSRFTYPRGVKIWELKRSAGDLTYEFIKDLPTNGLLQTVFSPDGKRLLAASGPYIRQVRRFDVENWIEAPFDEPLGGQNPAFSPDGKLIVVETGTGVAQLVDADSGREYARLEDPNQHRTMVFAFTPDGTTLVCGSGDGYCVHRWDLAAIRRQLSEMGLDWDSPPLPRLPAANVERADVQTELAQ